MTPRPTPAAPPPESVDRPRVRINMAMTADGKINTAARNVPGFGSPRDIDNLHRLRAGADAILCGARTVEESGAVMDHGGEKYLRIRRGLGLDRPAFRVLVTGRGTVSPQAPVWSYRGSPLLVITGGGLTAARRRTLSERADAVWESPGAGVDLAAALAWLRREHGVRHLLAEGGGELNFALFRAGLVDELHLTVCPRVFGGRTAPTLAGGGGFDRLADATRLELVRARRSGDEMFLVYRVVRRGRAVPGSPGP